MKKLVPLFLGCLLTGCGMNGCRGKEQFDLPQTVGALSEFAVKSREEAKAAREAKEYEKASTAATRAEAAAEKANALLTAMTAPTDADQTAKKATAIAAREARRYAKLSDEDRRLADLLNGWKSKAYRSGRQLAFPTACKGLAQAAEQAATTDPKDLPDSVRDTAKVAADVAHEYTGRKPLPNGQPDWPAVAADLRSLSAAPPPEMAQALAVAFLLTGKKEFALYEIEMIDTSLVKSREQKNHYHLLRGFIYSNNGLPLLAGEEINKAPAIGAVDDPTYGRELLAGVHLLLAYVHIESKDYEEADREIVRALRAWPNNPVAVFLTGERQAATGEYEKAAASLEAAARGADAEWLAVRIARRARELRDNPGKSDTILHDDGFLCEIAIQYVAIAAKNSDAAKALQRSIKTAQELGETVVKNLPVVGGE